VSRTVQEPDEQGSPGDDITDPSLETDSASGSLQTAFTPVENDAPLPWICPKCGETVDAGFQVCWSCGTSVEGVEDPEFESALETPAAGHHSGAITFHEEDSDEPSSGPVARQCAHCQGALEPGFIADFQRGQYVMTPSEWVAGNPQPSFWTGTWTGDRRFPIQAFRCTRCGQLEFWARET
jgi:hypothetical protein